MSEARQQYPEHIHEPIRRQIAQMLIEKEFLKLFPTLKPAERQAMHGDSEGWFKGQGYELAPVHDFWNASEGILDGFKLKHIVRFLTAENVTWNKAHVPVDELQVWAHLPGLIADAGEPPYTAQQLRALCADPAVYRRQIADDEAHSQPARNHYPIITLQKMGQLTLLDGNRRLMHAILHNRPTLEAYQGTYKDNEDEPHNYWVSTQTIRNLLFLLHEAPEPQKSDIQKAVHTILHGWFAVSTIAKTNFRRATASKFKQYYFLEQASYDEAKPI